MKSRAFIVTFPYIWREALKDEWSRAKRERARERTLMTMFELLDPATTEAGTASCRFLSQYLGFLCEL